MANDGASRKCQIRVAANNENCVNCAHQALAWGQVAPGCGGWCWAGAGAALRCATLRCATRRYATLRFTSRELLAVPAGDGDRIGLEPPVVSGPSRPMPGEWPLPPVAHSRRSTLAHAGRRARLAGPRRRSSFVERAGRQRCRACSPDTRHPPLRLRTTPENSRSRTRAAATSRPARTHDARRRSARPGSLGARPTRGLPEEMTAARARARVRRGRGRRVHLALLRRATREGGNSSDAGTG